MTFSLIWIQEQQKCSIASLLILISKQITSKHVYSKSRILFPHSFERKSSSYLMKSWVTESNSADYFQNFKKQHWRSVWVFFTGPSNDTLPAEPQGGVWPACPCGVMRPQHRHLPLCHPHWKNVQGPLGEDGRQNQILEETLVRFWPSQEELLLLRGWGLNEERFSLKQWLILFYLIIE